MDEEKEIRHDGKKYRCRGCGYESDVKWGRLYPRDGCPCCGGYFSIVRRRAGEKVGRSFASFADLKFPPRISSGIREFDRVLGGGGFIPGFSFVLAGPPGVGKTTFLIQVSNGFATEHRRVLYAAGEQSDKDLGRAAVRMGTLNPSMSVLGNQGDVYEIIEAVKTFRPKLIIVDAIQNAHVSDVKADEGSDAQVLAATNIYTSYCKDHETILILSSHVNASGGVRGTLELSHIVDGILYFDELDEEDLNLDEKESDDLDGMKDIRVLSTGKIREARSGEKAYFEMSAEGLRPPTGKWRRRLSKLTLVD